MFHFGLCDPHEGTKGVIDRLCIREGGGNVIVKFDDIHPLPIAGGILATYSPGQRSKIIFRPQIIRCFSGFLHKNFAPFVSLHVLT